MSRSKLPENLNDMVLGAGAPIEQSYGWNHSLPTVAPEAAAEIFQQSRDILDDAITRFPSAEMLARLSYQRKINGQPGANRLEQAELELTQALMLRSHPGKDNIESFDIGSFSKAIKQDMQLFLSLKAKRDDTSRGILLRRRQIETLHVRHTMYPEDVIDVFSAVCRELGDVGVPDLGVNFSEISEILFHAVTLVSAQISIWRRNHGDDPPTEADRLNSLFEVSPGLLAHLHKKCTENQIVQILKMASLCFGDLAEDNRDHLYLNNPVWSKPFVRDGGRFYLFIGETIYAFHNEILAEIGKTIIGKSFSQRLGDARGKALEQLLETSLSMLAPSAMRMIGAKWQDPSTPNKTFETDAICLVDGIGIIFEAKGHALSPKGRRGSQDWFDDFDDIVVEATEQASRLSRLLLTPPADGLALQSGDRTYIIQPGEITHVIRFGVALERTVSVSYSLAEALLDRLAQNGFSPMPALTYGDIGLLCRLIPMEVARIHYLLRRYEIENDFNFIADELDLIALYLRTGFAHLQPNRKERATLTIYGLSDFLRFYQKGSIYYDSRILIPKRTTSFWNKLLTRLSREKPEHWVSIAYDLLNVSIQSQERFERDLLRSYKRWRRNSFKGNPEPAVMQAPGQLRPSLFIGFPSSKDRLTSASERFCSWIQKFHGGERVICIGLSIEKQIMKPSIAVYNGRTWDAVFYVRKLEGDGISANFMFDAGPQE